MAQPECNKTDSDKSREETLISRLLEVVQLRNAVIESLDMDRRREAEEDQVSIIINIANALQIAHEFESNLIMYVSHRA